MEVHLSFGKQLHSANSEWQPLRPTLLNVVQNVIEEVSVYQLAYKRPYSPAICCIISEGIIPMFLLCCNASYWYPSNIRGWPYEATINVETHPVSHVQVGEQQESARCSVCRALELWYSSTTRFQLTNKIPHILKMNAPNLFGWPSSFGINLQLFEVVLHATVDDRFEDSNDKGNMATNLQGHALTRIIIWEKLKGGHNGALNSEPWEKTENEPMTL